MTPLPRLSWRCSQRSRYIWFLVTFLLIERRTEILTIDFEEEDPESAFVPLCAIDGLREIHLLSGDTLVTRRLGDGGEVSIWDLNDLHHEKLQLVNPSLLQVSWFPCNADHY